MKAFYAVVIVAGIGIGIYGFSFDDQSARARSECDALYEEWLRLTPDKTELSSKSNFSRLPDSLASQFEGAIVSSHVLSQRYGEMQEKNERIGAISALLLAAVSIVGIVRSRREK